MVGFAAANFAILKWYMGTLKADSQAAVKDLENELAVRSEKLKKLQDSSFETAASELEKRIYARMPIDKLASLIADGVHATGSMSERINNVKSSLDSQRQRLNAVDSEIKKADADLKTAAAKVSEAVARSEEVMGKIDKSEATGTVAAIARLLEGNEPLKAYTNSVSSLESKVASHGVALTALKPLADSKPLSAFVRDLGVTSTEKGHYFVFGSSIQVKGEVHAEGHVVAVDSIVAPYFRSFGAKVYDTAGDDIVILSGARLHRKDGVLK